jgi:hypothetical protein
MNVVVSGQIVRLRARFHTSAGVAADPTTVTWRLINPAGVETEYVSGTAPEATRESVGNYVLRMQYITTGDWHCRVEGEGTIVACEEPVVPFIRVRSSRFAGAEP